MVRQTLFSPTVIGTGITVMGFRSGERYWAQLNEYSMSKKEFDGHRAGEGDPWMDY